MNYITRAAKVNTALQVIQHMNEGMNVTDACHEVGMPRSTYYYIVNREEESIALFLDMVRANESYNLWTILQTQNPILEKIIQDGLAETTKPRERLAIQKTLLKRADKLSQELLMHANAKDYAAEFMQGPKLQLGISSSNRGQVVLPNQQLVGWIERFLRNPTYRL